MLTDEPFVVVELVKLQLAEPAGLHGGLSTPEVPSEAVKPAVWVPRHQPALPGSEQPSPGTLRTIDGAVLSNAKVGEVVAGDEVLPATSVQVPVVEAVELSGPE